MIDEARRYGYEFVTVGECLGDPKNNWYRDFKTGLQLGGPPPAQVVVSSVAAAASPPPSSPPPNRPASNMPAPLDTTASISSAKGPASTQGAGVTPKSSSTSSSASPTPTNSATGGIPGVTVSVLVAQVLFLCLYAAFS